jgi:hypothetical protein
MWMSMLLYNHQQQEHEATSLAEVVMLVQKLVIA